MVVIRGNQCGIQRDLMDTSKILSNSKEKIVEIFIIFSFADYKSLVYPAELEVCTFYISTEKFVEESCQLKTISL